jgi:hypothetical protein
VDYYSSRHKTLSEELTSWWQGQADFKTKRALAESLKVHPDTIGNYFSGRKFPKGDVARRLWEITKIACLEHGTVSESPLSIAPLPSQSRVAAPMPEDPDTTGLPGFKDDYDSKNSGDVMKRKAPREAPREATKKGDRYTERSIVVSFQRTICPLCGHIIREFRDCANCGQHFTWANVPLEQDGLSRRLLDSR